MVENRSLEVDSKLTDIGVLGFIFSSSINSPRFFGNAELSEHCDLESLIHGHGHVPGMTSREVVNMAIIELVRVTIGLNLLLQC